MITYARTFASLAFLPTHTPPAKMVCTYFQARGRNARLLTCRALFDERRNVVHRDLQRDGKLAEEKPSARRRYFSSVLPMRF